MPRSGCACDIGTDPETGDDVILEWCLMHAEIRDENATLRAQLAAANEAGEKLLDKWSTASGALEITLSHLRQAEVQLAATLARAEKAEAERDALALHLEDMGYTDDGINGIRRAALSSPEPRDGTVDTMLMIDGKSHRCECGCNVFRRGAGKRYICNACHATYYED